MPGIRLRSADGQVSMLDIEDPYTAQIEDLIKELTKGAARRFRLDRPRYARLGQVENQPAIRRLQRPQARAAAR